MRQPTLGPENASSDPGLICDQRGLAKDGSLCRVQKQGRGNANGGCTRWHIDQDDSIGTYDCVITNGYSSKYLGPRADINVTPYRWYALCAMPDCHLLKDQTIRPYHCSRMYDDAVGVRHQQATSDCAVQWHIGPSYNAPKPMTQNGNFLDNNPQRVARRAVPLVATQASKQGTRWIPGNPSFELPGKIRD